MKKEEKKKLREKTAGELEAELKKKEKELAEARFKLAQGQLKNFHLVGKIKDEIAVIKTIIKEKTKKEQ